MIHLKTMDRRRFARIHGGYDAEIIHEGRNYAAIIENLSENGVCVITLPTGIPVDIAPGEKLKTKFRPHPGETLVLNCIVRWSNKTPPHGLTTRLGMEIIDPPWDKSGSFI